MYETILRGANGNNKIYITRYEYQDINNKTWRFQNKETLGYRIAFPNRNPSHIVVRC